MNATPEELDRLFPDRHEEAERINLNPDLRAYFVPLPKEGAGFTKEQLNAIFPLERRIAFTHELLQLLHDTKQDQPSNTDETAQDVDKC